MIKIPQRIILNLRRMIFREKRYRVVLTDEGSVKLLTNTLPQAEIEGFDIKRREISSPITRREEIPTEITGEWMGSLFLFRFISSEDVERREGGNK